MTEQEMKEIFERFDCGDFRFIEPSAIITGQWVRMKCRFGCPDHGKSVMCPPYLPSVSECREFFDEYSRAVIFHFSARLDDPEARHAWTRKIDRNLLRIEREVFLANHYKAFVLFVDPCNFCEKCVKDVADCRDALNARPSGEGLGVDIYATARAAGYEIDVLQDLTDEMNRFGFLLID